MSPHRRGGLARNPLETLVPDPAGPPPAVAPAAPEEELAETPGGTPAEPELPAQAAPADRPRKPVKFGGYLDPEIADQVRDTLVALGPEWTVGEFMEQAFLAFMRAKQDELNDGKPFPHRRRDKLRTGRRVE